MQTAEGALTQVNSMLNRMHDLIVQAANTASSDTTARQAAQNEIMQLRDEIDRIGKTTAFGNQNLLDGSFGAQAARATNVDHRHRCPRRRERQQRVGDTFALVLDSGATHAACR